MARKPTEQKPTDEEWPVEPADRAARQVETDEQALAVAEQRYAKGRVAFADDRRPRFLAVLEKTGSYQAACDAIGIDRKTAYNARKADPEFKELCEEAQERYRTALVAEIHRRAIVGVEEPVYQGGILVGTKRVYSDRLLETLAKAKIPEFRESVAIEHSGGVGVTVGVLVVSGDRPQSPEEWAKNHALPPAATASDSGDVEEP